MFCKSTFLAVIYQSLGVTTSTYFYRRVWRAYVIGGIVSTGDILKVDYGHLNVYLNGRFCGQT